jgi:hypothetical protein
MFYSLIDPKILQSLRGQPRSDKIVYSKNPSQDTVPLRRKVSREFLSSKSTWKVIIDLIIIHGLKGVDFISVRRIGGGRNGKGGSTITVVQVVKVFVHMESLLEVVEAFQQLPICGHIVWRCCSNGGRCGRELPVVIIKRITILKRWPSIFFCGFSVQVVGSCLCSYKKNNNT